MKKTRRNCKNHTKNAKNDISGITDILLGFSPNWLSPITSFHHFGDNQYYRDILESVTSLRSQVLISSMYFSRELLQACLQCRVSLLRGTPGIESPHSLRLICSSDTGTDAPSPTLLALAPPSLVLTEDDHPPAD
jgi:hypothetical protein